jgi:hypothetical protein
VLAAAAATGDDSYLDLLRPALDTMIANGKVMAFADADSSLPAKWYPQLGQAVTTPTMLVPFRHSDRGWFDYNPMLAAIPMALWHHSNDPADRQRLEELRKAAGYDWRTVRSFRSKEEAGHEELVSSIDPQATVVDLVNLDPEHDRTVIVQADAFAEHTLQAVRYTACPDRSWLGSLTTTGTASRPSPSTTLRCARRG